MAYKYERTFNPNKAKSFMDLFCGLADKFRPVEPSDWDGTYKFVSQLVYRWMEEVRDKNGVSQFYHCERVATLAGYWMVHLIQVENDFGLHDVIVTNPKNSREAYFATLVGLLHDAVEEGCCTQEFIEKLVGPYVARSVDAITRRDGETYKDYIRRCSKNRLAAIIKMVDIMDNLSPARICENTDSLSERYFWALRYLYLSTFIPREEGNEEVE